MKLIRTFGLTAAALVLSGLAVSQRASAFDCDQTQAGLCYVAQASCYNDCNAEYPGICYCDNDYSACMSRAQCDAPPIEDSCD